MENTIGGRYVCGIRWRKGGRLIFGDTFGRPPVAPTEQGPGTKPYTFYTPRQSLRDTPLKREYETNNEMK
jgi:hypothetical protein